MTVAMGTTFATTMLSEDVSIASGLAGIVTLVAIQALTVWTSVKYPGCVTGRKGSRSCCCTMVRPIPEPWSERASAWMNCGRPFARKGFGRFEHLAALVLEVNGKFAVIDR